MKRAEGMLGLPYRSGALPDLATHGDGSSGASPS
jgi:hypothetical protein